VEHILSDEHLEGLFATETVRAEISWAKNDRVTPEQFFAEAEGREEHAMGRVYVRYRAALLERHAIDLDDMVLQPL
jgi:superfamily I DNA/RNA helicase